MKSALIRVLFFLCAICVFGDAETVSVIEGDSVTLHTDVTEIRSSDLIEWRLNGNRIAIISDDVASTAGASRDRLQLDKQTGDLKITNIKTTDSGEYKLEITSTGGSSEKTFSVTVVSGVDEVKSVSVIEGDSVTLNSGTIIQRDDVIEWRFGDLNSLIAENNRKTGNFSTSDGPDGRFRDRLQLDYSTGSLTITHTSTKHSGLYEAGIRKSRHTIHKSYSVTVSGDRERKSESVMKGDSVTLHTDLTEIQTDDVMQWMFEDTVIAEINKAQKQFLTSDVPDGRFKGRLKLDHQTRSLNITHTRFTDSGLYKLKISSSRFIINKRITVTVTGLSRGDVAGIAVVLLACGAAVAAAVAAAVIHHRHWISELKEWIYRERMLSVMEGKTITLNPDDTDVHKDDKLVWMFRGSCIAERESAADSLTLHDDLPDGRFKGRLEQDPQTGYLTIPDTKTTDSGVYELLIFRLGKTSIKRFSVSVFTDRDTDEIKDVSVKKGESVTLKTGVNIQKVERIQWKFGYTLLAKIKKGTKKFSPLVDKIFEGRLKLDHQTGSLTIKNTRPTDAGIYMLFKIEGGNIKTILFRVEVRDSTDNRNNPEEVRLTTVYG